MPITDWPLMERPREKLLQRGPAALSDAELLAIFLRTGLPGVTALDIARQMLIDCGGLRRLLETSVDELCQTKGVGQSSYVILQAALELTRRHLAEKLQREDVISCPLDTRNYLMARLRHHPQEIFACLFLDNRHRVIHYEELFRGTIDGASVHPREVVRRAMQHNAAAVILAHNHPSGIAEPSQADQQLTRRLRDALALVDIRVLDHLVIGDLECVSFAERGLL